MNVKLQKIIENNTRWQNTDVQNCLLLDPGTPGTPRMLHIYVDVKEQDRMAKNEDPLVVLQKGIQNVSDLAYELCRQDILEKLMEHRTSLSERLDAASQIKFLDNVIRIITVFPKD